MLCLLTLRNLRVLLIDLVTSRSLALIGSLWIQSSRFDLRVDVHQLLGDVLEVWVTRHLGPAFLDLLLLNLGGESCVVPLLSHEIDQATLPWVCSFFLEGLLEVIQRLAGVAVVLG